MSTTTRRQIGAGPSPRCKGTAALNSGTLKWLKAELDLLRMAVQRPCHALGTKPHRLLQIIWEAQGVRFALEEPCPPPARAWEFILPFAELPIATGQAVLPYSRFSKRISP